MHGTYIPSHRDRAGEALHNLQDVEVNIVDGQTQRAVRLGDVSGMPRTAVADNRIVATAAGHQAPQSPVAAQPVTPSPAAGVGLSALLREAVPPAAPQSVQQPVAPPTHPTVRAVVELNDMSQLAVFHDVIVAASCVVLVYRSDYGGPRYVVSSDMLANAEGGFALLLPDVPQPTAWELFVTGVEFSHNGYDYAVYMHGGGKQLNPATVASVLSQLQGS